MKRSFIKNFASRQSLVTKEISTIEYPEFSGVLIILFTALFLIRCSQPEQPGVPPNIILIMADDLGFSDIGCYGGEIRTPNLDALAANGIRFTQFYNAARCCPTRAALLTGLFPHQAGMGKMVSKIGHPRKPGPYQGYLSRNAPTIAEALKSAGYSSYMSGKWHVGEDPQNWPLTRGFERYFGLISGASSYYEILKNQPRVRQMVLEDQGWEPPVEGFYMTDAITDYAVARIREHSQTRKNPFFLYLAYTAPHWPLHALPEDIAKYQGFYDIGWDSLRVLRFQKLRELGIIDNNCPLSPRAETIPAWQDAENKADWSRRMAVHAAMVDRMDQGIGKIIAALEQNGNFENTIIFFLSDNGASSEDITHRKLHIPGTEIGVRGSYAAFREPWANAADTPFRFYKKWVHEGGIATPLIVQWPKGIPGNGAIHSQIGHVIDLLPTCLELAGAKYPALYNGNILKDLPGINLLPVFDGQTIIERPPLFWEHFGNRAVRDGKWKLVAEKDHPWELYDMEADRSELNNLAGEYPEKVQDLEAKYTEWANVVGVD